MSNDYVDFTYTLTGAGWARARLRIGGDSVRLRVSYLDDALGDLVRGVRALKRGASPVRVNWSDEPGTYRWILDRAGDDVRVTLLAFHDLWFQEPDEDGTVLLDRTCAVAALSDAVAAGARAVLEEWGEDGYRRRWCEHDFPTGALLQLEADA